ncbi:type IV toxin-antitoxin system AbiEi family antitoxin domain-containing protein [Neochlamydia sp. AcF84]|uniref:type IV toxin-antitoxin system AbiEi family antitoxin domain-containing protein n=1 Tax=Neochlamydia sp. AcF84 TaxID=2315858 RepID=UPI00140CFB0A|nr:type IV toxin-antitoxin system AbiEi family antitoxin domain-containing protein [Neochlamydia sp. AcF84]
MKKYEDKLEKLLNLPFFTLKEAENQGISRCTVIYLTKNGILEKLCPGIYRSSTYEPQVDFDWEKLAFTVASIPEGVICLISALFYYELTDQIRREAWIAIPNQRHSPKRPDAHIVRMRNTDLEKETLTMGEYTVHIFDRERTIVDAFRYLSKEIALKALRQYFTSADIKPDSKKLIEYAHILRVNINPYIFLIPHAC